MGRFQGPNALLEPFEERQVVGHTAHERLAEVYVALHEARDDDATGCIDDTERPLGRTSAWQDGGNTFALYQEIGTLGAAFGLSRTTVGEGDDVAPSNECLHGLSMLEKPPKCQECQEG